MLVMTGSDFRMEDDLLVEAHLQALDIFARLTALATQGGVAGARLSARELECLRLTAEGLTSEEISLKLGLSIHTANQYLGNAARKLNAVNRMHAVAKALRTGLID